MDSNDAKLDGTLKVVSKTRNHQGKGESVGQAIALSEENEE